MRIGRNRIQPYSPSIDNIQTVSNFYGVDSKMLSSEKSIFENYDCGDPCQRKKRSCDGKDHIPKWSPSHFTCSI